MLGLGPVFAQSTSAVVNTSTCERPEYPSASRRLEEEGSVKLKFLVGTDGKVIDSQVEKSSGFRRLDEAARQGLLKCQFKPASVGGIPQQSWATMTYTWRLETKTANSPNQCPPQLRLSAGYGCLYDYRFTSQKDIETNREIAQIAAQSMGYVITAAKDKNCNSISIKSITSSNAGDDSIAKSLSACQKQGCECGILVNNGIVVDQNLFSKYANYSTQNTSIQSVSPPVNNVPLVGESSLPACLGAGFGHNCWGTVTDANGKKYVGEFQNYKRRGQGIEYSQNGNVLRSGVWLNNGLSESRTIDTKLFPFNATFLNPTAAIDDQLTNDNAKEERDRLALEVERERQKRQELEQQLRVAQQSIQPNKQPVTLGIERRVALVIGNATYKVNPLKIL